MTDQFPPVAVTLYTDTGCSYAWGSEPKLRRLRWRYGEVLSIRRVLGGLVGDMSSWYDDSFDPAAAADTYIQYWQSVSETTGMPYPTHLEWMYRSTEPGCLAVKAAEQQGPAVAEAVMRRLQEATFVFGRPPDTRERIRETLEPFSDVDADRLIEAMDSPEVKQAFQDDWEETRDPNEYVMNLEGTPEESGRAKHTEGHWRYVFPTLIFRSAAGERTVPGWRDYGEYEAAMEAVAPGSTANPRGDPTVVEVFDRWPSLAPRELEFLCGVEVEQAEKRKGDDPGTQLPEEIVTYDWGDGAFYLTPAEATARGCVE